MRLLITAGPTSVPLDSVRVITNTATGRTGEALANHAASRGHQVVLLTSKPPDFVSAATGVVVERFISPADLSRLLESHIHLGPQDAIIHSAAISDFEVGAILDCHGKEASHHKLDSDQAPFTVELKKAPKLIDQFRTTWGFSGILVGFKLESGLSDQDLLAESEITRTRTSATLMVANHFQTAAKEAWVGPNQKGIYQKVDRTKLPVFLLDLITARLKR